MSLVPFLLYVLTKIAADLIHPGILARLIYKAAMNDLDLKTRPEIDLWAKIDKLGMHEFNQINLLEQLSSIEPSAFPYAFIKS